MKKKFIRLCVVIIIVSAALPISVSAESISDVLQKSGVVSYADRPNIFSIPADQFSSRIPEENPAANEGKNIKWSLCSDNSSTISGMYGTKSDGIRYRLSTHEYTYDSDGDGASDICVISPAGSTDVLEIRRGVGHGAPGNTIGAGAVGIRDIQMGDGYSDVIKKLGLPGELANHNYISIYAFKNRASEGFVFDTNESPEILILIDHLLIQMYWDDQL